MSAPKSLAKRQKLERKRNRKQQARRRQKQKSDGVREACSSFDFGAPGGVRMSDILQRFVRPLMDDVEGEDAYRRLLTLAMLAWNAALVPEARQQEMVDDVLGKAMDGASQEQQAGCREIVSRLIERKEKYFFMYRRPILNFHLTDLGDEYHLAVISAVV